MLDAAPALQSAADSGREKQDKGERGRGFQEEQIRVPVVKPPVKRELGKGLANEMLYHGRSHCSSTPHALQGRGKMR